MTAGRYRRFVSGETASNLSLPSVADQRSRLWLPRPLAAMAQPHVAGLVALIVYLLRAALSETHLQVTNAAYFNFLADAFLHGQLSLRLPPSNLFDLVQYGGQLYLYWPPFPAILLMPFVALFGVGVSDVLLTVLCGALTIALLARLLIVLDAQGIAPLSVERRGILVTTVAFGTVLLILVPTGKVWFTSQVVGWGCVLLATLAGLRPGGKLSYFLTGLALACAMGTRVSLLFNGLWLAWFMFQRDRDQRPRDRLAAIACGLAPVLLTLGLLGWYNAARFGSPLDMGIAWHNMDKVFRDDFARYGMFNLHYLPINIYYHFVTHPFLIFLTLIPSFPTLASPSMGGGLFWMTPVFLAAPVAVWRGRRQPIIWALVLTCLLVYVPIGLLMGTGFLTFGPRYLLDFFVPLVVLTALGMRHWRIDRLQVLLIISCATYLIGSAIWFVVE